jgi:hypothetical protein
MQLSGRQNARSLAAPIIVATLVVAICLAWAKIATRSDSEARTLISARGSGAAPAPAALPVPPGKGGPAVLPAITYPAEGVDLRPIVTPPSTPAAADAADPESVRRSLAQQLVPQQILGELMNTGVPSLQMESVIETAPVSSEVPTGRAYPGWVVTFDNVTPQPVGPSDAATIPGPCKFVAIMSRETGSWTEFFTTCGAP